VYTHDVDELYGVGEVGVLVDVLDGHRRKLDAGALDNHLRSRDGQHLNLLQLTHAAEQHLPRPSSSFYLPNNTSVCTCQSCPWVGLTHGLGCVALGRYFSAFGGFDWVGSTIAKVLKN